VVAVSMMVSMQCGLQHSSSMHISSHLSTTSRRPQTFGDENEEHLSCLLLNASPVLRRVHSQPVSSSEVGAVCSALPSKLLSHVSVHTRMTQSACTLSTESFGDSRLLTPPSTPTASVKKLESSASGHPYSAFWDFTVGEWAPHHHAEHSRQASPAKGIDSEARETDSALTERLEARTWTMLRTNVAQVLEAPTTRRRKDVNSLIEMLERVSPCADCPKHLREALRNGPPGFGSGPELQRWIYCVQNNVNDNPNKPAFNCHEPGA